jgi:hypothetical protein
MSALGQKQTYAAQQAMSALLPNATAKADILRFVMSALPPKATYAVRHVNLIFSSLNLEMKAGGALCPAREPYPST